MTEIRDIDAVVFDVLGTLVDEPGGLRAHIRALLPTADDGTVDELLALWESHVETEQARVVRGIRPYANSEFIEAEAARRVADHAGIDDPEAVAHLVTAGRRLFPWGDSVAGLDRIARHYPVLGLSNASRSALLRLDAHAGLRWHQVLSAEEVQAYKPAPEVYRLAVDVAGSPAERVLMVAAHAWDLRGAQAVGMRTAYVRRPVGDPPQDSDTFDGHFENLDELAAALTEG
ncbi:haloacid dehalogenase type II [Nocardiopsis alba]|uniref:haloacid dehalogenase type II n=1 Tax=Nocardiopsis alba TaxID=53437 RepID=UPI0033A709EF